MTARRRRTKVALFVTLPALVVAACSAAGTVAPPVAETARARVELSVDGMACEACASRLQAELRDPDGVLEADVDFASARARVVFDPAQVSPHALVAAVAEIGFDGRIVDGDPPERDLAARPR